MRFTGRPSREEASTLERARTYLMALADQGNETVSIRRVLELLGVTWQEPEHQEPRPDPAADPLTGCRPVVPPGG